MPRRRKPRAGSLAFWPRKRARKILPSVNWKVLKGKGFLGFVGYKVGMCSVVARDLTPHSMTYGKEIVLPSTILEFPPMKIFSVRLYKNNNVAGEMQIEAEKELKRRTRLQKKKEKDIEEFLKKECDDIRVIAYTLARQTGIKKTPDIVEIGIGGSIEEKKEIVKKILRKEITIEKFFSPNELVDVHGVTKGKGFAGPIKRFGIHLRQAKSEKGRRKPGSLGPWKPAKVSFRVAMAGQLGFFTRMQRNNKILDIASIKEHDINPPSGFMHYGKIKTFYGILKGSLPGPKKRALLVTIASRPTKKKQKEKFEIKKIMK